MINYTLVNLLAKSTHTSRKAGHSLFLAMEAQMTSRKFLFFFTGRYTGMIVSILISSFLEDTNTKSNFEYQGY